MKTVVWTRPAKVDGTQHYTSACGRFRIVRQKVPATFHAAFYLYWNEATTEKKYEAVTLRHAKGYAQKLAERLPSS